MSTKTVKTLGIGSIVAITLAFIVATFIEKNQSPDIAQAAVYNTYWMAAFWAITGLFTLHAVCRKKRLQQVSTLLIHLGLVVIIGGFILSKVTSHSGTMTLKQGMYYQSYVEKGNSTGKANLTALPFSILLLNCEVENYIGSSQASGFTSQVQLVDTQRSTNTKHTISMNNPLKYKGYRFYQSTMNEQQNSSSLMVNYDPYGTPVVYVGYLLVCLGLCLSFFVKKSRINTLIKKLKESRPQHLSLLAIAAFACCHNIQATPLSSTLKIDEDCANFVGEMWAQDGKGRLKPINTIATELIHKIAGEQCYEDLSANQFFVSLMMYPEQWKDIEVIQVKHKELRQYLHLKSKKAAFQQLFDSAGHYKLDSLLAVANKKGNTTTGFDKEVEALSERVELYIRITQLDFLKVFPNKVSIQSTWLSPNDELERLPQEDALFIKKAFFLYFSAVKANKKDDAHKMAASIAKYQTLLCAEVLPSHQKRKAEILYNTANVFPLLFKIYGTLGFIILLFTILFIGKEKTTKRGNWIFFSLTLLAFITHTAFLIIRAYVSGHFPVSNGYEIMLFISWISTLIAIIYLRKEAMIAASALIFSCLTLLVANFSWMNPEITNLVPVLKSKWLSIHVSTIMLAYALAGIVAFISLLNLALLATVRTSHISRYTSYLNRANISNELLVWISTFFMFIGIVTGSVWANESWGNYWSWDPKEVWALITLIVYSALAHSYRKITFTNAAIFNIIAFTFILITYFGVNYYFGGKHAYSGSSTFSLPISVIISTVIIIPMVAFAKFKEKTLKHPNK